MAAFGRLLPQTGNAMCVVKPLSNLTVPFGEEKRLANTEKDNAWFSDIGTAQIQYYK